MTKHKWHKEIKAWADGAEIEFKLENAWWDAGIPEWNEDGEYRIKPQPKEPQYLYVSKGYDGTPQLSFIEHQDALFKIKLEVDDETN